MNQIRQQTGMALFVALIVLLVITMLGVTGLRSGIFHSRMSTNSQADTLTFMGAESAINGVVSYAWQIGQNGVDESFFAKAIFDEKQTNCVSKSLVVHGACTHELTLDRRASGILIAQAETEYRGETAVPNYDGEYFAYHTFDTKGTSYFVADLDLPFGSQNSQEWKKFGVAGQFSLTAAEIAGGDGN